MASNLGKLYSQPNQSGSSNSLPYHNGTGGLGLKSTKQPSFTASTSSIPGALGIGSNSSTPILSTVASSSTLAGRDQSSTVHHTSSTSTSNLLGEGSKEAKPIYQMQSISVDSLRSDGQVKPDSMDNGVDPIQQKMMKGVNGSSSSRNVLVPIGATGARQKLSILSASQRPMTGQNALEPPLIGLPQRPRTSSETGRGPEGEGLFARRPQTAENTSQGGAALFASPKYSAGKTDNVGNLRRPSTGTGEPIRTLMNESTSSERGAGLGQWKQDGHTLTQDRLHNPMYPQRINDDFSSKATPYPPSSRSYPSLAKEAQSSPGSASRYGNAPRRFISAELPSEQYTSTAEYNVWEQQLPNDSPKRMTDRPISSSGRERAAKLGAGFKSMFSSKSKENSPKMASQHGAMESSSTSPSQGSPQSSTPRRSQSRPTASPSTSHQSPQTPTSSRLAAKQTFVDLNTAQSAGWTASQDHRQSSPSTSLALSSSPPATRLQSRLYVNEKSLNSNGGMKRLKSPDIAPSIDFALPASSPFMDNFSTGTLSLLNQDSNVATRGLGTTRLAKGPATTGLNLEVAGHSIPLLQHLIEQEPANKSTDKSLPATPNNGSLSDTSEEGRQAQQRNHSEASNWSEATVLGPAATITSPGSFDPNRTSSNSSVGSLSRRGSNATTHSEANGSDSAHNAARRPSSSTQSISGESNYSAPNSSRAWSPAAFDKPSVPITSPLLASILGQQQQSAELSSSQLRKVASPQSVSLNGGVFVSSESSMAATPTTTPSTPTSSSRSPGSTPVKPDLPTRSKERTLILQPDPATLAKLEQGSSTTSVLPAVVSTTSTDGVTDTPKTPTLQSKAMPAPQTRSEGVNRSMYVPPGALTYTRKGTAVRLNAAKPNQTPTAISSDPGSTPRASPASLPPPVLATEGSKGSDGHVITFTSTDFENYEEGTSMDTVNLLPSSAWVEVEAALARFKTILNQSTPSDKGALLRSVLLPFLALEAETPNVEVSGTGPLSSSKARRSMFFEWIQHLLMELQTIQTSADRGAILESIACIIESRTFSAPMLQQDEVDEKKFFSVFGHILNYAIGELNKKGVYQNTLIFSGRLLAVAFFRVENVASKLLRALPVNRFALERVASEANWDARNPSLGDWEAYKQRFPPTLTDFCFQDARSYLKMLDSHTSNPLNSDGHTDDDRYLVRQAEVEVEMSGNWLRRWQSDDSELFFSFCRNYHRQLAGFVTTGRGCESMQTLFFGGPGYAHLATCIHQKCLSLVHRDILSVTTLSSQKNFNPGETANVLSGSTAGKPRHLEAANRRCTAIVVDIVRAPLSHPLIFGPMLGIHIKSLIKRTSLYDVQGVFCLLDWLDGVLGHMETAELPVERLVDVEFIIETTWLLLKDADHALALMRTIAFCYSNFAVMTSTTKNRVRFCEEILLHPKIFQKLFLSWSFTIRAYFLHLLVFRLARINDFAQPEDDVKGKTAVSVARLFNQRLDEIRRRHDELSPSPSSADSSSEEDNDLARSKARPQSFVSTIKHTPSSSNKHGSPSAWTWTKAERVLGIGYPDPALSTKGQNKSQSRAAKWLRALGGKGASKGGKRGGGAGPMPYLASSPSIESSSLGATGYGESHRRLGKMDELDLFSDEDDLGDDDSYPGDDDGGDSTPKAEGQFEFSFDAQSGHGDASPLQKKSAALAPMEQDKSLNDHISPKLSFDLQNPSSAAPPPPSSGAEDGNSINGKLSLSANHGPDRISRAFSKRQSILPGPAFNLVHHQSESEDDDASKEEMGDAADLVSNNSFANQRSLGSRQQAQKSDPYSQSLHIYAIQSLREYEQTVQEHDEFFAKQADASNPQVPRLPIQWPAMWSE